METISFHLAERLASLLHLLLRLNVSSLWSSDGYSPFAADRSHGRIIWDCAWMVEKDEVAFATASRDKTVCVYHFTLKSYLSDFVTCRSKFGSLQMNFFPSGLLWLL